MKAYYHARAHEYDDWWLGRGRYTGQARPGFDKELEELGGLIRQLSPVRTLDVGCGTGFLTQHLRGEVVGLDSSETMLELARERVPSVTFVQDDALALPFGDGTFDRVFSTFFYCHLEEAERLQFLFEARRVARELVIIGSVPGEGDPLERWEERELGDGSRWRVFKRVFVPERLAEELDGRVAHAGEWFVMVVSP